MSVIDNEHMVIDLSVDGEDEEKIDSFLRRVYASGKKARAEFITDCEFSWMENLEKKAKLFKLDEYMFYSHSSNKGMLHCCEDDGTLKCYTTAHLFANPISVDPKAGTESFLSDDLWIDTLSFSEVLSYFDEIDFRGVDFKYIFGIIDDLSTNVPEHTGKHLKLTLPKCEWHEIPVLGSPTEITNIEDVGFSHEKRIPHNLQYLTKGTLLDLSKISLDGIESLNGAFVYFFTRPTVINFGYNTLPSLKLTDKDQLIAGVPLKIICTKELLAKLKKVLRKAEEIKIELID